MTFARYSLASLPDGSWQIAACWAIAYLLDVLEPDDWDKMLGELKWTTKTTQATMNGEGDE